MTNLITVAELLGQFERPLKEKLQNTGFEQMPLHNYLLLLFVQASKLRILKQRKEDLGQLILNDEENDPGISFPGTLKLINDGISMIS